MGTLWTLLDLMGPCRAAPENPVLPEGRVTIVGRLLNADRPAYALRWYAGSAASSKGGGGQKRAQFDTLAF
jgi:hypothetical protein